MKYQSFRSFFGNTRLVSGCVATVICLSMISVAHAADDRVPNSTGAPKIVLDVSQMDAQIAQAQALKQYGIAAQKKIEEWYPKIIELLGAQNGTHPPTVNIKIDMNYDGVAATAGDTIVVSGKYALAHPDDMGAMVHEMAHVVQGYPKYNPVWLVEGIADYVRWFNYEPLSARPHPDPAKVHYNDSYRTTGSFLNYVVNKYDKNIVKKLDAALKADTYSPEMFKTATGKSIDELSTEWLAQLQKDKDAAAKAK